MNTQPTLMEIPPRRIERLVPPPGESAWRHVVAVLMLTAVCDATIYRGHGYAGLALLFAVAPSLLALGSSGFRQRLDLSVVGAMLLVLVGRLVWQGSPLQVAIGFWLLVALAMTLSGLRPFVIETIVFASQTLAAGGVGLIDYGRSARNYSPKFSRLGWISVAMPAAALFAFSLLFVLANPDLMAMFGENVQRFLTALRDWFVNQGPRPTEFLFWGVVFWIATGLLRPLMTNALMEEFSIDAIREKRLASDVQPAALYPAFRNMLGAVILLFAAYLVFEFKTLWFREFPKGFYYSGYAHEGAFWLTVALALATLILSLVFRGSILGDPRRQALRRLAWVWSAENLLLAIAVIHRLMIYVGFNGMTRMRVIGFFGIAAVIAGFLLVLWKIARERDFVWLVRRQLWALGITIYLFAITPVDWLVMDYNVRRILHGDPAPAVQISVHPISPEGILQLPPLIESPNATIAEGVKALLANDLESAEVSQAQRREQGWTTFQAADRRMLERLRRHQAELKSFASPADRAQALQRFHDYAYQWF